MKSTLLGLINGLTPFKITNLATDSSGGFEDEDRHEVDSALDGNVVSSLRRDDPWPQAGRRHAVLLDLDVPAYLVPSSTEGHSHLYIDVTVPEAAYFRLLDALAECEVIEPGYASASKAKGGTFLRLPWVKKAHEIPESVGSLSQPVSIDVFA